MKAHLEQNESVTLIFSAKDDKVGKVFLSAKWLPDNSPGTIYCRGQDNCFGASNLKMLK